MRTTATARRASGRPGGVPRPRQLTWLTAGLLLLGSAATACTTAGASQASGGTSPSATATAPGQSSASPASVAGVTLHVGDQAGAGAQALLTAAGLIGKLPFRVEWSDFTSGPPMLQAMGSGSIDVGTVGDAPPVFAAAGGSPIAAISALRANPLGSAILVPKNSPIQNVAQLRGKRIAVTQGSAANYHLLAILARAGLSIHDVTPDYLQPPDAQAAFASGQVDAWDVWSPFVEQALAQDHARVLASGAAIGTTYSFVVASRTALASPATARAIGDYLRLLDQAYAWAAAHQAVWAATWAKATGLPESVMLAAVTDSLARPTPITPAVLSSEQRIANAFTAAGLIPAHVDFAKFSVTSYSNIPGGSS
ncbi:MAG TPA: ABC transporter substrate-binding protein [Streptosporangiaceae bacterium]